MVVSDFDRAKDDDIFIFDFFSTIPVHAFIVKSSNNRCVKIPIYSVFYLFVGILTSAGPLKNNYYYIKKFQIWQLRF